MHKRRFRLPSPALVISMVTLCLVLGGTAVAATTEKHSDVRADTKLIKKLAPSLSVKHAQTANNATSATNATNATTADNAHSLGGVDASAYLQSNVVQRGTFVLNPGTTGTVLFTSGSLSVTADCTLSAGTTTVTMHLVSTVAKWLDSATLEASAGSVVNNTLNDGGSGTFSGSTGRIDLETAPLGHPGPQAMHGQDMYGVNWPSQGQCYVSGWVVVS